MHLSALYSSPLGYDEADRRGGTKFKPLQELSFEKDIEQIKQSLKDGKSRVNYSINIATPMNFISALSKNPSILHFIGHGIQADHFSKGNYLVLENDDGSGQLVSSTKLKMIIDVCNAKLDTVFLSSCYSESEADVFLHAGANHVICIQRDK
jgi:CHAT domain-containing protein